MLLKKGTQVKIITGKDKGKTGEILEIDRRLNKVKNKVNKYDQKAPQTHKRKQRWNYFKRKFYTFI